MKENMKKNYITPELTVAASELKSSLLDPSITIDSEDTVEAGSVEVKSERNSGGSYNVWNDDWSK